MTEVVATFLKKHIFSLLKSLLQPAWRFIFLPLKKCFFPLKDMKTGIKQSRMRYYFVRFSFQDGEKYVVYQEVDSNGNFKRYVGRDGQRYFPQEIHECTVIGKKEFQSPSWGKMDWRDVFNGDLNSGCWGITGR